MTSQIHYTVCPVTGLSSTCRDDYKHTTLWATEHHSVRDAKQLYSLIETKASTLPKSYIVAGILLQLHEAGLVYAVKAEPRYLRGKINERMQAYSQYDLVSLYWHCRNSAASPEGLSRLKINLTTADAQPLDGLYKTIKAVACQSVPSSDRSEYQAARTRRENKTRDAKRTSSNLSIKAVSKRVSKLVLSLHNALPDTEIEVRSVKKVAELVAWDTVMQCPCWYYSTQQVKERIIELLQQIAKEAQAQDMLQMDTIQMRSIGIVISYLRGDKADAALGVEIETLGL